MLNILPRWARRAVPAIALSLSALAAGCLAAQADRDETTEDPGTQEEGLSGAVPAGTVLRTLADLNLRAGPSTSTAILRVMPAGSKVLVESPTPENGFYSISHDGTLGWASGKYLEPENADVEDPTPEDPAPTTPVAGGHLWTFKAKTLAVEIAVFVPAAAAQAPEVDVLVYSHGLNVCSPVAKSPPASFVTGAPFHLAQIVADSERPVVLVVPFMDWEHLYANGMSAGGSNHKLGVPKHLNGVVAEVLGQVGQQQNTAAPSLTSLLLAGHSRAYSFLNPLAAASADPQMSEGALARLTHVWGLDSSYSCNLGSWTSWLAAKPDLHVDMFYKSGTGTASCGKLFANAAASTEGHLTSNPVPEPHCAVPATQLPALLAALP